MCLNIFFRFGKRRHTAAKIAAAAVCAALAPIIIDVDVKKKELNIASLLLSVRRRPSEEDEKRRVTVVDIPGIPLIAEYCRKARGICTAGFAKIRAAAKKKKNA